MAEVRRPRLSCWDEFIILAESELDWADFLVLGRTPKCGTIFFIAEAEFLIRGSRYNVKTELL
jgi:hypothetical protein